MTVILSIDVGIKNLSYCLLEVTNCNTVKVIDWDNIAITDKNCKKIKMQGSRTVVTKQVREPPPDSSFHGMSPFLKGEISCRIFILSNA